MIVPERSDKIRKVTLPTWVLRMSLIVGAAVLFLSAVLIFDYLHMLSESAENKKLQVENHMLKTEIQSAKTKVEALDQTLNRLKSFAQKLRVISNLDQPGTRKLLDAPPEGLNKGGSSPVNGNEEPGGIGDDPGDEGTGASLEPAPPPEDSATSTKEERLHARLEYQRSRTLLSENWGADFDAQTLTWQIEQITSASTRLREIAELEEQNLVELQEHLQDRIFKLLSTPSILPTLGYVSSEFGSRYNPFSGVRTFHAGMDIANHIGTVIHAPADGKVTKVGFAGGFGTVIRIDHGYGVVTKYGHLSKAYVKPGERIKRGEKIAEMGNSGRSTGPHLHYQVEVNGRPVQPRTFILDDMF